MIKMKLCGLLSPQNFIIGVSPPFVFILCIFVTTCVGRTSWPKNNFANVRCGQFSVLPGAQYWYYYYYYCYSNYRVYRANICFLYPIRSLYVEGPNRRYHSNHRLNTIFHIAPLAQKRQQLPPFSNISIDKLNFLRFWYRLSLILLSRW